MCQYIYIYINTHKIKCTSREYTVNNCFFFHHCTAKIPPPEATCIPLHHKADTKTFNHNPTISSSMCIKATQVHVICNSIELEMYIILKTKNVDYQLMNSTILLCTCTCTDLKGEKELEISHNAIYC